MKKNNKNIDLYYDKLCDLWLKNSIELEFSTFCENFDYSKYRKQLYYIFNLLDKNKLNSIHSLCIIEIKLLKLNNAIMKERLYFKDNKIEQLKKGGK